MSDDDDRDPLTYPDGRGNQIRYIRGTDYGDFTFFAEHRINNHFCYFKRIYQGRGSPPKIINKMLSSIDYLERKIINFYPGVFPNDEVFIHFRLYLLDKIFSRNLDEYLRRKYMEITFIEQRKRGKTSATQGQLSKYFPGYATSDEFTAYVASTASDDTSDIEDGLEDGLEDNSSTELMSSDVRPSSGGRKKSRKRKLIKSRTSKKRKQIKRQSKKQRNNRNSRRSNKIKKLYTRKISK